MKSFTTTLEKVNSSLGWNYHIRVSDEIAQNFIEGEFRRVVCTINDNVKLHSALMPDGQGGWYIFMNQQVRKRLHLEPGDQMTISLEKDSSEYGTFMPTELEEMLNQDDEGSKYFQELTPGKQRSLIHLVSKVKNTDSRLRKALAIVHHLKEVHGNLDFKLLNETIKYYNNLK